MKVILTAFDGLMKSDIKEWPDLPCDGTVYYPLRQMRSHVGLSFNEIGASFDFVDIRATFKTTGKVFTDEAGYQVYELVLIDVHPRYWEDGGQQEKERELLMAKLALSKALEIAQNPEAAIKFISDWEIVE